MEKPFVRTKNIISETKVNEDIENTLLSDDKNIIYDQNTQNDLDDDDDETSAIVNID